MMIQIASASESLFLHSRSLESFSRCFVVIGNLYIDDVVVDNERRRLTTTGFSSYSHELKYSSE
jgi:hypothetical protein